MRVTIIIENTTIREDLAAEHGLSMLVETDNGTVLFDAGQTEAAAENLRILGCNDKAPDAVVISHGHYDHTGGLPAVLKIFEALPVHLHPDAFQPRWSIRPGTDPRQIGIPWNRSELEPIARLHESREPGEVVPGVFTTGEVPRMTDFEDVGGPFFLDESGTSPDPLHDDMSLIVEKKDGLVILLGCAHSGVVNILEHVSTMFPGKPVQVVAGGMHLVAASSERISRTEEYLDQQNIKLIMPGHCTGDEAISRLTARFAPNRRISGGMVLDF